MNEPDAGSIADEVLKCSGVLTLHAGQFGEIATYLPGGRVTGVRIGTDRIEVHVVATYGIPLSDIASGVRSRLQSLVGNRQIDVVIEDVARSTVEVTGGRVTVNET